MSNPNKRTSKVHRGMLVASNVAVALANPGLTAALRSGESTQASLARSDHTDVVLDASITTFRTMKEVAESIPSIGGPLKATCGVMVLVLQTIKVTLVLLQVYLTDSG
jgi:hypothetical protein